MTTRETILNSYFGEFGGQYVPELLVPALDQLEEAFVSAQSDPQFQAELSRLLRDFVGRPTPITQCLNLPRAQGVEIFLKREDLLHGGAHKTNQVIGQALLAKRMGKRRIIAETGAGQHGTATALACALLDLDCTVYMGRLDVERQRPNVERMELLGARVVPVDTGSGTLKDAVNEALRDWTASFRTSHYLLGTAAGPHPFPTLVREFHRIISTEAKAQMLERIGRLPDEVIACVGGGSNAIGLFADFIDEPQVRLTGVEPGGEGVETGRHGAPIGAGRIGIFHGARSYLMRTADGQIEESHSVSAGLDYPGVGPQHAHLSATGRARYVAITDRQALGAFQLLARAEGIIPALESSHALAYALQVAAKAKSGTNLLVSLSGRGDKDLDHVNAQLRQLRAEGVDLEAEIFTPTPAPATVLSPVPDPSGTSADAAGPAPADEPPARPLSQRYERIFAGSDGAFVPFVMIGDPDLETSEAIIEQLIASGADALELGIAFSDPVADGPTIQRAHLRALAAGATPANSLDLVQRLRERHPDLPIGLLIYGNLPFTWGIDAFYQRAAEAGVDSVLVADVPVREGEQFALSAQRHGVNPIFIAPPAAARSTLTGVARLARGYVYVVSRVGVTGTEVESQAEGLTEIVNYLTELGAPPALLGFGISRPDHVRTALAGGARGAISGSAIVALIEERVTAGDMPGAITAVGRFVERMKAATRAQ